MVFWIGYRYLAFQTSSGYHTQVDSRSIRNRRDLAQHLQAQMVATQLPWGSSEEEEEEEVESGGRIDSNISYQNGTSTIDRQDPGGERDAAEDKDSHVRSDVGFGDSCCPDGACLYHGPAPVELTAENGAPYPHLYCDRRALVPGPPWSYLHAKCVAVDGQRGFVSSANFTTRTEDRNIEAGVLLQDAAFAAQLERQWLSLIEDGLVLPMFDA